MQQLLLFIKRQSLKYCYLHQHIYSNEEDFVSVFSIEDSKGVFVTMPMCFPPGEHGLKQETNRKHILKILVS